MADISDDHPVSCLDFFKAHFIDFLWKNEMNRILCFKYFSIVIFVFCCQVGALQRAALKIRFVEFS